MTTEKVEAVRLTSCCMNVSEYAGRAPTFSCMLTTACCVVEQSRPLPELCAWSKQ